MKFLTAAPVCFLLAGVALANPPCGTVVQAAPVCAAPTYQQTHSAYNYAVAVPVLPAVFVPVASYALGLAHTGQTPPGEKAEGEAKPPPAPAADAKLDKILALLEKHQSRLDALESGTKPARAAAPLPPVAAVVAANCAACHTGPNPKGGFGYDLSDLDAETAAKMVASVSNNSMPPKSKPALPPADRKAMLTQLTQLAK